MIKKRIVLLPQPIEAEAVQVLEKGNAHLLTASEPKPEIVGPLMKEAQAVVLRTGIKMTRELLAYPNELVMISRTGAGRSVQWFPPRKHRQSGSLIAGEVEVSEKEVMTADSNKPGGKP
ncbi:MAG: hypothetical protein Q8K00_03585 [Syntrophales bacterium]|nr:hypothetical protein [Syntrophales bacterium]